MSQSSTTSDYKFLAQGTLYPDVVESSSSKNSKSQVIKSHHNVGGLPENMDFKLIEPLRDLFKDEAREVGRRLGLPDEIIDRHPFPGPGLAIRIIGEITKEKIEILRLADKIFIEELKKTPNQFEIDRLQKFDPNSSFWSELNVDLQNYAVCINLLISDSKGNLYSQKRSKTRRLLPGLWETSVRGHLEPNETLLNCIQRELVEETGWTLGKIHSYMGQHTEGSSFGKPILSHTFYISVDGDLQNPALEAGKVDQFAWIKETNLDFLEENDKFESLSRSTIERYFGDRMFSNCKKNSLYHDVWQAFCVLTDVKSVGVMGDERTYESLLGIRAVTAVDGMTADWARLPYDFLAKVSNLIINQVRGINRVVYDISSKPPATIEWE
jgi:GMP synthase PP-ATPase subunit/ADP-ribose pyrophosphatase YjhB (NUDIX family)